MSAIFGKKEDKDQKTTETVEATSDTKEKKAKTVKTKEDTGDAYRILIKPIITEKSFKGASMRKFVFKVSPKANKISVARAVERVYDVHVQDVNMVSVKGKRRTFGKTQGRTSDWKKAIVTLKEGETIPGVES